MKFMILICIISFAMAAKADEFRTFTNLEGKTIEARILQYDTKGERVQLELQNQKKAWIEIGSLSEEDQIYIKDSYEKSTSDTDNDIAAGKITALSNKEMRDIGEAYIEAILNKDYAAWSSLMLNTEGVNKEHFMNFYAPKDWRYDKHYRDYGASWLIERMKIRKIRHNYIILKINTEAEDREEEWNIALQLLPDGKIKYDNLFLRHPAIIAKVCVVHLYHCHGRERLEQMRMPDAWRNTHLNPYADMLKQSGVPLFGYNKDASWDEAIESLDHIKNWLINHFEEWDSGEPELFLPRDVIASLSLFREGG